MKFLLPPLSLCVIFSGPLQAQITEAFPFPADTPSQSRFRLTVGEAPVRFQLRPTGKGAKPFAGVDLRPDKQGWALNIAQNGEALPTVEKNLLFWPSPGSREERGIDGITPKSWRGRELRALLRSNGRVVSLWVEGKLIFQSPLPSGGGELKIASTAGTLHADTEADQSPVALSATSLWEPVELSHLIAPRAKAKMTEYEGVPFEVFGSEVLSLKEAGWPEASNDRGGYTEAYDAGGYFLGDRRVPMTQAPKADYIAAHLLAYISDDVDGEPVVTLRMGRRVRGASKTSQVLLRDFATRLDESAKKPTVVTIPLGEQFAQDVVDHRIDIEITKALRLARRTPDPNRFRWRPLGKPSNVVIAAVTLEKSPIAVAIDPLSEGALFYENQDQGYRVTLKNITSDARPYLLELTIGNRTETAEGKLAPQEEKEIVLKTAPLPPGHYSAAISLESNARRLLSRHTALGVLPPDDRKHRADAPWGTWDFTGGHFTSADGDLVGTLMHRLGLRYGMLNSPYEVRKKYGVIKGNVYRIGNKNPDADFLAEYEKARAEHPDLMPEVYIFHEASISGGHATRVPDLFHDRPPYKLNAEEQAQFDLFRKAAENGVRQIRAKYPEVKFHLGNGPIPLREEFVRQGYSAELFDTFGNENPTFARIPETQPPDPIANNSSLWMDHELLKGYGYTKTGVSQAHETIYPGTNPGNLSYQTHADYIVRHILHSMSWGMPKIRPGGTMDVGNSYYHSNWGGTGFFTQHPRLAPKPAAVALATLTQVLDGAAYVGSCDLGSDSLYALLFQRKDGQQVVALWTVRGERSVTLELDKANAVTLISQMGARSQPALKDGKVELTLTASPQWLMLPEGAAIASATPGRPVYPDSDPVGKVSELDPLESLDGWQVVAEPNALLNYYNPMTPRRHGNFRFAPVSNFEGHAALSVAAGPMTTGKETMPMVMELERKEPISLPGKPAEVGLWVNGNSGWGRLIIELEDASGQQWISIGAKARAGSEWLADWLGKERAANYEPGEIADWNTDDAWSLSRINFDGWRYLGIALPGNYAGEHFPWAANSQWKSNKDGVVHYPLKLKKIVIELPEKILHLRDYRPARRPEIYLRRVVSVERPVDEPKQAVGDYQENVQTSVR